MFGAHEAEVQQQIHKLLDDGRLQNIVYKQHDPCQGEEPHRKDADPDEKA